MGGVLVAAETLPTTKTQRLLERNHRDPSKSCILTQKHTQSIWLDQLAMRCACFLPRYLHQEPLVLHVLSPWHHVQFGDHGMLS